MNYSVIFIKSFISIVHHRLSSCLIFPQLRSLTINKASLTQLHSIHPRYLPHLVHLSVIPLYIETEQELQLLKTLFVDKERFTQLKSCRLESLRDILPSLTIQEPSPLRALTLDRCEPDIILMAKSITIMPDITIVQEYSENFNLIGIVLIKWDILYLNEIRLTLHKIPNQIIFSYTHKYIPNPIVHT